MNKNKLIQYPKKNVTHFHKRAYVSIPFNPTIIHRLASGTPWLHKADLPFRKRPINPNRHSFLRQSPDPLFFMVITASETIPKSHSCKCNAKLYTCIANVYTCFTNAMQMHNLINLKKHPENKTKHANLCTCNAHAMQIYANAMHMQCKKYICYAHSFFSLLYFSLLYIYLVPSTGTDRE
jgi:hypothetical protein